MFGTYEIYLIDNTILLRDSLQNPEGESTAVFIINTQLCLFRFGKKAIIRRFPIFFSMFNSICGLLWNIIIW